MFLRRVLRRVVSIPRHVQRSQKHQQQVLQVEHDHRERAKRMLDFYSKFLLAGQLVFDVGANQGHWTNVFLQLGCTVIAVEPQPECTTVLLDRFHNNANFHLVNMGLASRKGEQELLICSTANTISTMSSNWKNSVFASGRFREYSWDKTLVVPVTTLDALILEFELPQFCKIDVEGFEKSVLTGLSQPIPQLSFEFTYPETYDDTIWCLGYLDKLGMSRLNYSIGESFELAKPSWMSRSELEDELNKYGGGMTFGDIYASTPI